MHTDPQPPSAIPATPTRDLDRSLIRGIAWTGGGRWLTQIISWIATPIVARLLNPGDYGVASMAMVYVGLVQLVNEFGLGPAIVRQRDLTPDQIARLGGLSVLLGALFSAVSIALASPVAQFFGNAEVEAVIIALSVIFVASSLQAIPRALLTRDLSFRRLAALDAFEAAGNIVVTLPLAALGFRYWALVIGGITGRMVSTVLALHWRGHSLRWPSQFQSISSSVTFGWHVVVSSIAWYVFLNADLAVVGRVLGSAALGSYSIGLTLASIPVDRLSALVSRATPGILAKVQHDRLALRRYVLALTEGTALLTFPVAVGLALVANELVLVVLGEEWRAAVTPLRVLAVAAVFRSLTPLLSQILFATGESRRNMYAAIATAVVLPPSFYAAARWGIGAVAFVWLAVYPFIAAAFAMRYAFRASEMKVRRYLAALWPATGATLVMVAAVLTVDALTPGAWPLALMLALKCFTGAATYSAVVWYLHGDRLRRFYATLREPSATERVVLDDGSVPVADVAPS